MTHRRTAHGEWRQDDASTFIELFTGQVSKYGLAFMDEGGRITGWSEGSYCITGYAADDVMGQAFSLLFTPEDLANGMDVHELNAARTLGAVEDERWHMRKDGSRFWASGMTLPMLKDDVLQGYAKVFRDATHLRLRMMTSENEVRVLSKDKHDRGVFLATIAHELRNPLQPMTLATRLLAQASDPERHEQAVKILNRQLGFMERLIEDLIDMTRVGEGKLKIDYERVELQRLLREAVDACHEFAATSRVTLVSVLPPVPITIEVDPGRMHQVVINLLNNAIKFTPNGGHVSVQASADQTHFLLKVQDTGEGIGAELQPRLFEMFTQADAASTKRGDGLGIGLALVKQIVALHHGTVEAKSEGRNKGSEFIVRIPLLRPAGPEYGAPIGLDRL